MTIEPFGELRYYQIDKEWSGRVSNISQGNKVELSIRAVNDQQNISDEIELIREFVNDYEEILEKLYYLVYLSFHGSEWEKSLDEIKQMYFLTAISLKDTNKTWWLVLEPHFSVTAIYNHFMRFTMVDRELVWANFDV